MDMPVSAEWSTGRRQNVFRIAARTPRELRVSRRSAGLGTGETPWGADPKRHGSPRLLRERAREGTSGGESSRDGLEVMCFVGGSVTLEPRPWNQGGRAQVPSSRRSFRPRTPQSSRLWSTADERAQRVRKRITAQPLERVARERTPGAAEDLASPRGRRERNPSRGRETPRTDRAGCGKPGSYRSLRRCR